MNETGMPAGGPPYRRPQTADTRHARTHRAAVDAGSRSGAGAAPRHCSAVGHPLKARVHREYGRSLRVSMPSEQMLGQWYSQGNSHEFSWAFTLPVHTCDATKCQLPCHNPLRMCRKGTSLLSNWTLAGAGQCRRRGVGMVIASIHDPAAPRITEAFLNSVPSDAGSCHLVLAQEPCARRTKKRCMENFFKAGMTKQAFLHDLLVLLMAETSERNREPPFAMLVDADMVFLRPMSPIVAQLRATEFDILFTEPPTDPGPLHEQYLANIGSYFVRPSPRVASFFNVWTVLNAQLNAVIQDQKWLTYLVAGYLPKLSVPGRNTNASSNASSMVLTPHATVGELKMGTLPTELLPISNRLEALPPCAILYHAFGSMGDTEKLERMHRALVRRGAHDEGRCARGTSLPCTFVKRHLEHGAWSPSQSQQNAFHLHASARNMILQGSRGTRLEAGALLLASPHVT